MSADSFTTVTLNTIFATVEANLNRLARDYCRKKCLEHPNSKYWPTSLSRTTDLSISRVHMIIKSKGYAPVRLKDKYTGLYYIVLDREPNIADFE